MNGSPKGNGKKDKDSKYKPMVDEQSEFNLENEDLVTCDFHIHLDHLNLTKKTRFMTNKLNKVSDYRIRFANRHFKLKESKKLNNYLNLLGEQKKI